jgi:hypothetical protein
MPNIASDRFEELNRVTFSKLNEEKLRPQFNIDGLTILKLQALRERDLRELYRNRAPYELLQNADDANATRAVFIVTNAGLAFAHNGNWFTVDNFRSLAQGWSDKDPKECIGHKGLGFRSVLDISPAPHIFRIDSTEIFGVKFSWSLNKGHIDITLHKDPSLRLDHDAYKKHGQAYCPIMHIPGLVKKQSLDSAAIVLLELLAQGKFGEKLTTLFWFPGKDAEIPQNILEDIGPMPLIGSDGVRRLLDFLRSEVNVLIPFLSSIRNVEIYSDNKLIAQISVLQNDDDRRTHGEIGVLSVIDGRSNRSSYFQMTFEDMIPPNIRNLRDNPSAIKKGVISRVKITIAVQIKDGQPCFNDHAKFHVYFPTEETTGVGYIIHGDFYVEPNRKRLMPGEYNNWLLRFAARKAANEFLTALLQEYDSGSVFTALSPVSWNLPDSAKSFQNSFTSELKQRRAPFIPTRFGLLSQQEVLLPPTVDQDGFWDSRFFDVVPEFDDTKKAFLLPGTDNGSTRDFLRMTDIRLLQSDDIFDFIELAQETEKDAEWWYWCYEYMTTDNDLSRKDKNYFEGRKIIPCADSIIRSPGDKSDTVICLPPQGDIPIHTVPHLFSNVFTFLNNEVARYLNDEDNVSHWVLDKFQISRFEASDLLPRAVRRIAPEIFKGNIHNGL